MRVAGWTDKALRVALSAAHSVLRVHWLIRRPRTFGAHALALTPERRIVLVKLRYAPGWRLPGGGRAEHEDARDAVLRELREEIGLISHGRVGFGAELEQRPDFKRDLASILVVEDVHYRPRRWSWEVEAICEAPIDALPADLAPIAAEWIDALRGKI